MRGKAKWKYHEVFSVLKLYFFDQYVPGSEEIVGKCVWHNIEGALNLGKKIIEEELAKIEKQEAKDETRTDL